MPAISVDLILSVLQKTFFYPFIACLIPLCLRAEAMDWRAPPMLVALGYASLVSLVHILAILNRYWATARLLPVASAETDGKQYDRASERSEGIAEDLSSDEDSHQHSALAPGRVVIVTGGASGLGRLIAFMYAMRGAVVAILDVRLLAEADSAVSGIFHYQCDVSDSQQVLKTAETIRREHGLPSVIINNAAIVLGTPLAETSIERLDLSLRTNLHAYFYVTKAFLPFLVACARRARSRSSPSHTPTIVTISSVIGSLGAAQLADYAAAKAGATAMHYSIKAELEPRGIRCLLVAPGQLDTPLFRGIRTPNSFFAPVVDAVSIARDIVEAIEGGRPTALMADGRIARPLYARHTDWYHVLPASLQRLARRFAGVDTAMSTFQGRSDFDPEPHPS